MHTRDIRQRGFTLIELMIVVAIVGILAAVAYASYSSSVQKSRRAEAKEALLNAAARQERWVISSVGNVYANGGTGGAAGPELGGPVSENGYYNITVSNARVAGVDCPTPGLCFEVRAAPSAGSPQNDDTNCAVFSIDNLGRKKSYLADGTTETTDTARCW